MRQLPAGKFKATCLQVMNEVQSRRETVVITKRGKPVAKLVPIAEAAADDIFGFYAAQAKIVGELPRPLLSRKDWGRLY